MADFKAMLDDLMGKDRNLLPHERSRSKRHFSDRDVCKHFLARFCFHELFPKTKADLGPCRYVHDDPAKEAWDAVEDKGRYPYEADFLAECHRLIEECDDRTRRLRAKYREDSITSLKDQIKELMKKMEECGEVGKVEESVAINARKEKLELQLSKLQQGVGDEWLLMIPGTQKNVVPCAVCGAAVVGDHISHAEGKQHIGFEMIRQAKTEMEEILAARPPPATTEPKADPQPPGGVTDRTEKPATKKELEKERDHPRIRDGERTHEREWERRLRPPRAGSPGGRKRARSSEREGDHNHRRSRERDRDRRRDRSDGRDRSRDRDRGLEWGRRSRR
jgi:hypothetical protein